MNTTYTNAATLSQTQRLRLQNPYSNRIEKLIFNAMDHFFTMIILLSGEEEYDSISISHIL